MGKKKDRKKAKRQAKAKAESEADIAAAYRVDRPSLHLPDRLPGPRWNRKPG